MMREELEVDIERRLRSEFERAARLREEKERAARIREERERAAQDAVTPRRGGPPAPSETVSTPASEQVLFSFAMFVNKLLPYLCWWTFSLRRGNVDKC